MLNKAPRSACETCQTPPQLIRLICAGVRVRARACVRARASAHSREVGGCRTRLRQAAKRDAIESQRTQMLRRYLHEKALRAHLGKASVQLGLAQRVKALSAQRFNTPFNERRR